MSKNPALLLPHLLKPLVRHIRFALLFVACATTISAYAQVSTAVAKTDPKSASSNSSQLAQTQTNTANNPPPSKTRVILPRTPKDPVPFCDDVSKNDLKAYPVNSTLTASNTLKGEVNDSLILKGKACVVRADTRVQGDAINYDYASEQVTATGNAVLRRETGDEISGSVIHYNLSTKTGNAKNDSFAIASTEGRGKAESLDILSSRRAFMKDAYYTTCRAEDPDWYLKSDTMLIDQDNNVGTGTNAVLVFKHLPILATPYMRFPIGNKRKTGFLTPVFGSSSNSGISATLPYYVNIAPNYDLTLYPTIFTKRGVMLGGDYRFLTKYGNGELIGSYIPHDQVRNESRYFWHAQYDKSAPLGKAGTWHAWIDATRVSDNYYLDDISTKGVDPANRILSSEYGLEVKQGAWTIRLRQKTNQTLQNDSNTIDAPYDFKPQISVAGSQRWNNWIADVDYESTHFSHPDQTRTQGWRHFIYPSLSYEYRRAGWFIKPKIGINATAYSLTNVSADYDKNPSRVLPIASVDSGLIFERNNLNWLHRPAIQTFEPRLYYLYVPYKDQSRIWNFDSALASFDTAHIYSENIYTGRDRIAEANQVTIGATSRILDQDTGAQLFQATIAGRQYFHDQRVTLPGGTVDTNRKSDILASATGQLSSTMAIDTSTQYNIDTNKFLKTDIALRWQPETKKVLNIGYSKDDIVIPATKSIYISGQWPLTAISKSLYGVARMNYNLVDNRVDDTLLGFEYTKDCWIFSVAARRDISSTTNTFSNSVYVQLELKGLGALGGGSGQKPASTFSSYVPAYTPIHFESPVETNPATTTKGNIGK